MVRQGESAGHKDNIIDFYLQAKEIKYFFMQWDKITEEIIQRFHNIIIFLVGSYQIFL